jgi:hypothetical protein
MALPAGGYKFLAANSRKTQENGLCRITLNEMTKADAPFRPTYEQGLKGFPLFGGTLRR